VECERHVKRCRGQEEWGLRVGAFKRSRGFAVLDCGVMPKVPGVDCEFTPTDRIGKRRHGRRGREVWLELKEREITQRFGARGPPHRRPGKFDRLCHRVNIKPLMRPRKEKGKERTGEKKKRRKEERKEKHMKTDCIIDYCRCCRF